MKWVGAAQTLNDRLPLEHSSDRPQTLAKRVSDDSQHFICRRPKNLVGQIFDPGNQFVHNF